MQSNITVGVLALQGAFAEHVAACKNAAQKLGLQISVIEVRLPEQLKQIHGASSLHL
jgi:glutamine amidotransferase PdxT